MGVSYVFKIVLMVPNCVKRLIFWKDLIVLINPYHITGQLICNANFCTGFYVSHRSAWFHFERSLAFISNIFEASEISLFIENFRRLLLNIIYENNITCFNILQLLSTHIYVWVSGGHRMSAFKNFTSRNF